jgi:hypothetical protein
LDRAKKQVAGCETVTTRPQLRTRSTSAETPAKLHDLYLDDYGLFAEAFNGEVKPAAKTSYGGELKTNINLCRPYQHMIVDESAKLMTKVAALSSDEGEQKKAIAEFIFLHEQLAQVNEYLADVLLKLSFETGLDWRHQFQKLQSESVFYEQVQQLIAKPERPVRWPQSSCGFSGDCLIVEMVNCW